MRLVSQVVIAMGITVMALSACAPEPRTVDYYRAHPTEARKRMDECLGNPGKYRNDPDCLNANAALDTGIRGLKPVPLPKGPPP